MSGLHQPFVSKTGLDHIGHLSGLILKFLEALFIVIGVVAAGR